MRVLQVNLNHCEAAQDLLMQTVREHKVDLAIISEPYRNLDHPSWVVDKAGKAAVWACGKYPFQDISKRLENGFVRAKINGVHIFSCYMPPSMTLENFEGCLDRLVQEAKDRIPHAIAGDFNAWALDWGSKKTDKRGQALLEALSILNLVLLNDGKVPTYCKGDACSVIDLTFVSGGLANGDTRWQVSETYTHSDHRAITWETSRQQCKRRTLGGPKIIGWKANMFDIDVFREALDDSEIVTDNQSAEINAQELMKRVARACDATMPRRREGNHHPPMYWWNDVIARLRSDSNRTRRLAQRARGKNSYQALEAKHKASRTALTKAIKQSKRQSWIELLGEVEGDPWGRPYKVVMTCLKGQSRQQPTCPDQLRRIVSTLFPQQEKLNYQVEVEDTEAIPPVTQEELFRSCRKVGNKKAPGMDGIPNIALKAAVKEAPARFIEVYNACLREGKFPDPWKWQRLVLLPKGKKPPDDPSSYRPLCMLDTAGKILERIVHNRIEVAIGNSLAANQYGFRKSRSTLDAISHVVNTASQAISGARWKGGAKKYCLVVALDIKNAFNSARWSNICSALDKMNVPPYLKRIVGSYLDNRCLKYDTEDGSQEYIITGGVPQGSVLAPLLWNIMYDGLLKLTLPHGVEIVAFADDAAVVIVAKYLEEVNRMFEEIYNQIQHWMGTAGLKLAEHKTEAVLITSRKVMETIELTVGHHTITSQPSLKYLGLMIDARLSFKDHVEYVVGKAAKVRAALARLMPNIGGPRQARRKLLASVVTSVLTYGIAIWGNALNTEKYRRKTATVYRLSAIRVSCAFRTISEDAVCLLAGMPPIEILAEERRCLYHQRKSPTGLQVEHRGIIGKRSLQCWQQKWDASVKGRWTYRLIPQVESWLNRKHGEVDYYLTQMLSGHGCFRAYLNRFGHDESAECPSGCGVPEDAEHAFFRCPRFRGEREELKEVLAEAPTPETLVGLMMKTEENWAAISSFATAVLKKLRQEEKKRRRESAMMADVA